MTALSVCDRPSVTSAVRSPASVSRAAPGSALVPSQFRSLQPRAPARLSGRPGTGVCGVKAPRRPSRGHLCPGCVTNAPLLSHMSRVRGSSVTPGPQGLPRLAGRR
ncbi:hypothetical protein GCM10010104_53290 [Streptomyces indiaensis]|uniref:Uncharacterized protein n=1 Tax=Streptomyces indiaensis TaxID=284033 RepID=A0ABN3E6Z7_9ACTN